MVVVRRLQQTTFDCVSANLPAVSTGIAWQPTPFVNIPKNGDKMTFDPFVMTFKVDSEMKNYLEIFNWMKGQSHPNDFEEYSRLVRAGGEGLTSDIMLMPIGADRNPIKTITFVNCVPMQLSGIDFTIQLPDVDYATCMAGFFYTSFSIS